MTTVAGEKQRELNKLFDELRGQHNGYRCVKCHRQPWPAWAGDTHQLRCACGPDFDGRGGTLEPAGNWMKEKLADMIERQTGSGAIAIYNEETAIARVAEAKAGGLFPNNASPGQLALMAKAALAYGLDPVMGHLIIYQGKPYITIDGRRKLDSDAGHHPSISFRPLNSEEVEYYRSVDALKPRDVAQVCVGTTEWGSTIEAIGILLAEEREGNANTPQVKRPIEMTQKRGEMRWRKMAYGPNPMPAGLENVMSTAEEDIVEGASRVLDNTPIAEPTMPEDPPESAPVPTEEDTEKPSHYCHEHQSTRRPGSASGRWVHLIDGDKEQPCFEEVESELN